MYSVVIFLLFSVLIYIIISELKRGVRVRKERWELEEEHLRGTALDIKVDRRETKKENDDKLDMEM